MPNGLHHQWTIKALNSGKHVLCEKPLTNNADEARSMVAEAQLRNRLLVEAFHYRYHPLCNDTLRQILSNKDQIGRIQSVSANFTIPSMFLKNNDIRFQYELGGGAQMDLGCYLVSMCRFIVENFHEQPASNEHSFQVIKAEPLRVSPTNPQIDYGMRTSLTIDQIPCQMYCEFTNDWSMFKQQIVIECEKSVVTVSFMIAPSFYHWITVLNRATNRTETIKNYADNQSTYYHQLKAFINAVRLVEQGSMDQAYSVAFTSGSDGIRNMEIIDEIYRHAGLVIRGTPLPTKSSPSSA